MSNSMNEVKLSIKNVPEWDEDTQYIIGDKVIYDNTNYVCVVEFSTTHTFEDNEWSKYIPDEKGDFIYNIEVKVDDNDNFYQADFCGIADFNENEYESCMDKKMFYDDEKDKYFYVYYDDDSDKYFAKEINKDLFYWVQLKRIGE